MGRKLKIAASVPFIAAGALFIGNTSLFVPTPSGRAELLAHRGVHQRFSQEDVGNETCTARRILPPTHLLLENTIASMDAAFETGADIVEFDVQPTADGQFAVFHDRTLECRTDEKGVTREKTLTELKSLDIGYGYTADGGKTFPFRGKGIGLMPSLDEVLDTFPDRRFLIHVKSQDPEEGRLLAERLSRLDRNRRSLLTVYGDDAPANAVKNVLPDQRIASRGNLKTCLLRYVAFGWSGYVPEACRNGLMFAPSNVAPWLWGWPNRLAARLEAANAKLVILGPYSGGEFSTGIDTAEQLAELPPSLPAIIWTNNILDIALLAKRPVVLEPPDATP